MILERVPGQDRCVVYEVRKARKNYPCDSYPQSSAMNIKRGDFYLLATEMPGGESGYADSAGKPVRMRVCAECSYGRVQNFIASQGITSTAEQSATPKSKEQDHE